VSGIGHGEHTVTQAAAPGDAVMTAYRRFDHPIRRPDAGTIRTTCKLDRMGRASPTHETDAMRAADNELFDRGCDLAEPLDAARSA
jgi:hypothetical protein